MLREVVNLVEDGDTGEAEELLDRYEDLRSRLTPSTEQ